MRNKFKITAFIFFALLLTVSVIYNLITKQASLINWPEILLILVIVFVAVGDKISKMVISPKEVSIKQTVEQEVTRLEKDIQKIDKFVEEDSPADKITDIVNDTLEHPRDTWSKLLLIRMTLRRLLRKIADAYGMKYSPTASISSMAVTFYEQGIIDGFLAEQVEKIRNATFAVEWGAGQPPSLEDIRFTLESYGKVFNALKDRARASKRKAV